MKEKLNPGYAMLGKEGFTGVLGASLRLAPHHRLGIILQPTSNSHASLLKHS